MAEKVVCDGSTVTWEPKLEDTACDECGHACGQIDTAEPPFHGPEEERGGDWYCSRCGGLMVSAKHIAIIVDQMRPKIIAAVEKQNAFRQFLNSRPRG